MKKRISSFILAVLMLVSAFPVMTLVSGAETVETDYNSYYVQDGLIALFDASKYDAEKGVDVLGKAVTVSADVTTDENGSYVKDGTVKYTGILADDTGKFSGEMTTELVVRFDNGTEGGDYMPNNKDFLKAGFLAQNGYGISDSNPNLIRYGFGRFNADGTVNALTTGGVRIGSGVVANTDKLFAGINTIAFSQQVVLKEYTYDADVENFVAADGKIMPNPLKILENITKAEDISYSGHINAIDYYNGKLDHTFMTNENGETDKSIAARDQMPAFPFAYATSGKGFNNNGTDVVMGGEQSNVYGVRVYDRVLTETEVKWNHFVDIAKQFELDIADLCALLNSENPLFAGLKAGFVDKIDFLVTGLINNDVNKNAIENEIEALLGDYYYLLYAKQDNLVYLLSYLNATEQDNERAGFVNYGHPAWADAGNVADADIAAIDKAGAFNQQVQDDLLGKDASGNYLFERVYKKDKGMGSVSQYYTFNAGRVYVTKTESGNYGLSLTPTADAPVDVKDNGDLRVVAGHTMRFGEGYLSLAQSYAGYYWKNGVATEFNSSNASSLKTSSAVLTSLVATGADDTTLRTPIYTGSGDYTYQLVLEAGVNTQESGVLLQQHYQLFNTKDFVFGLMNPAANGGKTVRLRLTLDGVAYFSAANDHNVPTEQPMTFTFVKDTVVSGSDMPAADKGSKYVEKAKFDVYIDSERDEFLSDSYKSAFTQPGTTSTNNVPRADQLLWLSNSSQSYPSIAYQSGVNIYAYRVYDTTLTEDDILINRFVDIADLYDLDLTGFAANVKAADTMRVINEVLDAVDAEKGDLGYEKAEGKIYFQEVLDDACKSFTAITFNPNFVFEDEGEDEPDEEEETEKVLTGYNSYYVQKGLIALFDASTYKAGDTVDAMGTPVTVAGTVNAGGYIQGGTVTYSGILAEKTGKYEGKFAGSMTTEMVVEFNDNGADFLPNGKEYIRAGFSAKKGATSTTSRNLYVFLYPRLLASGAVVEQQSNGVRLGGGVVANDAKIIAGINTLTFSQQIVHKEYISDGTNFKAADGKAMPLPLNVASYLVKDEGMTYSGHINMMEYYNGILDNTFMTTDAGATDESITARYHQPAFPFAYATSGTGYNNNGSNVIAGNAVSNIYGVRVYDRVLTQAEVEWNHFVDIARQYELNIADLVTLKDAVGVEAGLVSTIAKAFINKEDNSIREKATVQAEYAELSKDIPEVLKAIADAKAYNDLYVQDGLIALFDASTYEAGDTVDFMGTPVTVAGTVQDGYIQGGKVTYAGILADATGKFTGSMTTEMVVRFVNAGGIANALPNGSQDIIKAGFVTQKGYGTEAKNANLTQFELALAKSDGTVSSFTTGGFRLGDAGNDPAKIGKIFAGINTLTQSQQVVLKEYTHDGSAFVATDKTAMPIPLNSSAKYTDTAATYNGHINFINYYNGILDNTYMTKADGTKDESITARIHDNAFPFAYATSGTGYNNNGSDVVVGGTQSNVYGVRVYNRVLTQAEVEWNRFVDFAKQYELDIKDIAALKDKVGIESGGIPVIVKAFMNAKDNTERDKATVQAEYAELSKDIPEVLKAIADAEIYNDLYVKDGLIAHFDASTYKAGDTVDFMGTPVTVILGTLQDGYMQGGTVTYSGILADKDGAYKDKFAASATTELVVEFDINGDDYFPSGEFMRAGFLTKKGLGGASYMSLLVYMQLIAKPNGVVTSVQTSGVRLGGDNNHRYITGINTLTQSQQIVHKAFVSDGTDFLADDGQKLLFPSILASTNIDRTNGVKYDGYVNAIDYFNGKLDNTFMTNAAGEIDKSISARFYHSASPFAYATSGTPYNNNGADVVTGNPQSKIYDVRVYNRVLTQAEVEWNHFVDIAKQNKFDVEELTFIKNELGIEAEVLSAIAKNFVVDKDNKFTGRDLANEYAGLTADFDELCKDLIYAEFYAEEGADGAEAQNHFVDIAKYFELDLTGFKALADEKKAPVYAAFAKYEVGEGDKAKLQELLDIKVSGKDVIDLGNSNETLKQLAAETPIVYFDGYQTRIEDYNGLRAVFSLNMDTIEALEAQGYTVKIGVAGAKASQLPVVEGVADREQLAVIYKNYEYAPLNGALYSFYDPTSENAVNGFVANYWNTDGQYRIGMAVKFEKSENQTKAYYEREFVFRAYVILEDGEGNTVIYYPDMKSPAYGETVSMSELAERQVEVKGNRNDLYTDVLTKVSVGEEAKSVTINGNRIEEYVIISYNGAHDVIANMLKAEILAQTGIELKVLDAPYSETSPKAIYVGENAKADGEFALTFADGLVNLDGHTYDEIKLAYDAFVAKLTAAVAGDLVMDTTAVN